MPAVVAFMIGTGMIGVLVALGARLRRALRMAASPSLAFPMNLLLGAWALTVALLILGLAGGLSVVPITACFVAAAVMGRWRPFRHGWIGVSAGALGAGIALPLATSSPFFYDALVYHLGLPWQAIQEGRWAAHPENVFSAFPPLAQMVNLPALAWGLERVPGMLHWWSFIAACAAVFALARALGAPRPWAALVAFLLPLLPGNALVAGIPASEGWLLAGVISVASLLVSGHRGGGLASAAGILMGIASASRLQGLTWTGLVLLALVLRSRSVGDGLRFTLAWLAGSAPWWLKNLWLLGDPVAPLGWRREGMETLWRDGGSGLAAVAGGEPISSVVASALDPHLLYLAPLVLAALLAVAARARGAVITGALAVGGVVAWLASGSLPRFLGPAAALLLGLAAASGGRRFARGGSAMALAAVAAAGGITTWHAIGVVGGLRVTLTGASATVAGLVQADPRPAFAACRALPRDARVLFVGEPRCLGFPRPFVVTSQHDVQPLREIVESGQSPRAVCLWLRQRGFTHVLVNHLELRRLSLGYPVAPWRTERGMERWLILLARWRPPVAAVGAVEVFSVPPCQPGD